MALEDPLIVALNSHRYLILADPALTIGSVKGGGAIT